MVNKSKYARPHFRWSELECHCGCGASFITSRSLDKLQAFRNIVGVPFSPNSASRCPVHNARIGGRPLSYHRSTETHPSCAFDIPILPGMSKEKIIASAIQAGFQGLGINYKTFVHIDDRGHKAIW